MMRAHTAEERAVIVSFEPDRLAQESLTRAYARLVADPGGAPWPGPWRQPRLLTHMGRDPQGQEGER